MLERLTAPVLEVLARETGLEPTALAGALAPPRVGDADLALPCFQPAQALGVAPPALAARLAAAVARSGLAEARAAGPFLNLRWTPAAVASAFLPLLADEPQLALRSAQGRGRTVCIDFSSPNIAKHLAVHHIRSTMIGHSLSRLYAAAGWRVVRINFLGDWGTAFGRLISGWKREGLQLPDLARAADPVGFLNELYVRASRAAEQDPALEEDARRWSKALEDGDPEARQLWQAFREASLAEFRRVYELLGVDFDDWRGESWYEDKMAPLLAELRARGLATVDDGATVVDLAARGFPQFKKPVLLQRADGGTLYATRDLAAADERYARYGFDRALYVVDLGQSLHFQEWFAVARLLGRPYADRLRHVGFGVLLMWNDEPGPGLAPGWAKGRTRAGRVMLLAEVLEEAVERARAIIAEKNPELVGEERERVARAVGIGAVVFNDLKHARVNDVKFRFEDALRFDGETGPYVQYAHARLCSIERKATVDGGGDPRLLTRDDEKAVLLAIAGLRAQLERAVDADEPSILAQAVLRLAGAVSAWLTAGNREHGAKVLGEDRELCAARLLLVRAARGALAEGLHLLGLAAPERM
ncbi:MAG: arginine--tRNA ligase [Planctomycetota bacterium]|nr:arginine--tRNA ligase [Planctomycetota bacterium]MCX8040565.1 arginine--tRNA ligase [Planctomycetota bacterium]MDW8372185.1 arginine--tRNA ligase [Planctomycetota bacterium]